MVTDTPRDEPSPSVVAVVWHFEQQQQVVVVAVVVVVVVVLIFRLEFRNF